MWRQKNVARSGKMWRMAAWRRGMTYVSAKLAKTLTWHAVLLRRRRSNNRQQLKKKRSELNGVRKIGVIW